MKKFFLFTLSGLFGFILGCTLYLFINLPIKIQYTPTPDTTHIKNDDKYTNVDIVPTTLINPFTGKLIENIDVNTNPFICLLENSKNIRPQLGISYADILYETYSSNESTKFLGLFLENSPNILGPIANSNNKNHSHNIFTSSDDLKTVFNNKLSLPLQLPSLVFDKLNWFDEDLGYSNGLNLKINDDYSTYYKYQNGLYEKYMDSCLAIDALTSFPLTFTNIIIQITPVEINQYDIISNINFIGSGYGYAFSNGKVQAIQWKKHCNDTPTILTTLDNKPLTLSPGNTIWHIVDNTCNISFE